MGYFMATTIPVLLFPYIIFIYTCGDLRVTSIEKCTVAGSNPALPDWEVAQW